MKTLLEIFKKELINEPNILNMEDLFGNKKPVQIEIGEWWFNGRIIQDQYHPQLMPFISFNDGAEGYFVTTHSTFKESEKYCLENPCTKPDRFPKNYIGGK